MKSILLPLCVCVLGCVTSVQAQQAFSFSLTAARRVAPATPQTPLAVFSGKRLDPLTGAETMFGRVRIAAFEDLRFDRNDGRQVRQVEFLTNVLGASSATRLAVGTGARRDSDGTNVLLTRLIAEAPTFAGRLVANVTFERPFAVGRDAMDMITTLAYSRAVNRITFVGVEALLQDVEGFWDPAEADGGARLFVGSSIDVVVPKANWRLHVTAGRDMRATSSLAMSDAFRALGRSGAVIRLAATHTF